jgi:two-component sensor histidine kinase/CheY-like chemotaxis protein
MNSEHKTVKPASIIIVDDTPANLELLAGMLKQRGYRVRTAPSGKLAIQAAQSEPPDLILLDINMPEMDGYEVCRILKENGTTRDIPVIFITAMDRDMDEERGLSLGAVDYITKPIRLPIVMARVQNHLQMKMQRDEIEAEVMARTADLDVANRELKSEIAERMKAEETIMKSLREKEMLIREIYHRTRNTIQVILGTIVLQVAKFSANPEMDQLVKNTENRIHVISLVHEMLYKSQDLSQISIKEYIQDLTVLMKKSNRLSDDSITFTITIDEQKFLIDTAIPLGLILNELITNSFKYAFPGKIKGIIDIKLTLEKSGNYLLKYSDNGVGVPDGFDFRNRGSLGMELIHSIGEKQMLGKVHMENNNGIRYSLEFPGNLYKARV